MKRKSLLLLIPLAVVGLAGCENVNPGPTPKPVPDPCDQSETHIAEHNVEVREGEKVQLHATTSVAGCPVVWASDHIDVATVDAEGYVTGVSSSINGGIAHISANGVQECTVTVKQSEPVHEHSFSTEWFKDENGHWHECSCGAKADEAAHVFGDDNICDDCGYDKEHVHSFSTEWFKDENGHWHQCSCGAKDNVVAHVFGDDNICDVCGYDKGEPVPHVHTFSPEWSSNDNEHWHAATCGHDVKGGLAVHVDTDGDSKCDVCNHAMPTDPVYGTEDNPISVSQAIATMNIDCPEDTNLTKKAMYCIGTVKEIQDGGVYDPGDNWFKLVATDGTSDVLVFRIHASDALKDNVQVGEEIKWVGFGKNFKGTLEFVDNGATKCTLLDNGTPTPPQKEVVEVLSVKSAPESVAVGGTITPSSVILNVKLNDETESTVAATIVECNTQVAADSVEATAWYKEVGSAKFNIKVVAQGQPVYGTEDNPISVTQALETMGIDCPNDKDLTKQAMYCIGTIKEIKNVYHYEGDIGSDCFELVLTDGTNDVIVYRLHSTDDLKDQVAEGNEIKICGYGKNFKGTLEFVDNGATKCTLLDNGTPTPPQKEVVEVLGVKSAPESIAVGGTITPSSVILNVKLNDETESTVAATKVECNTQAAADSVEATAWYKEVGSAKFNIKVVAQGQPVYGTEDNPISVTQALETMGIDCPNDKDLTKQAMYCIGTIKEIKNVYHYEGDIGSDCYELYATDGTNDVYVYRLHCTDDLKDSVVIGAQIKWMGFGKNFKGTLEFVDNGATKCTLLDNGTPTPPQKEITGVELQGTLEKSSYVEGQTFDPSGLSLKVTYNEGDPDVLTSGFTFNVTNPLAVGEYDLKATYQGHTTEGSVHISVVAKELVSIAITHGMNKTTYQVGDNWDATGIVVQGTYNDGDVQTIQSGSYQLSYSPENATDINVKSVSIVAKMIAGDEISSEAYPQTVSVQTDPVVEPELVDITIEGSLTKSDYKVGETYSTAGLSVLGHYDNESTKLLDVAITFNKTVAELGDTAIIASVEYEDLSDEKEFNVTVTKVDENTIDVSGVDSYSISADDLGLAGYSSSSNTNFAWTDLAKHDDSGTIQGNYKTGDKAKDSELHNVRAFSKNITYIKFSVGNASADTATAAIRFGTSALPTSNSTDIGANTSYVLNKVGDFIVSAPSGCGYFSLKWTKGASYYTSIEVHFDEYKADGVQGVSLNKTATTLAVGANETLTATVSPASATNKQVTWLSSAPAVATVDSNGKVTAVAEGTAIITVTTVDGSKTATCTVTVTSQGGGGGSETTSTPIDLGGDSKVVFGGVTYEKSLKAGSGKVAGTTAINVPSGAKKLIFYAAGWNNETVEISVTGGGISQTLSLTSDSGVSGNGPFTIGSTTESNFKFEIDVSSLTGATTLTLTATSGNRFVVWNASYTK